MRGWTAWSRSGARDGDTSPGRASARRLVRGQGKRRTRRRACRVVPAVPGGAGAGDGGARDVVGRGGLSAARAVGGGAGARRGEHSLDASDAEGGAASSAVVGGLPDDGGAGGADAVACA